MTEYNYLWYKSVGISEMSGEFTVKLVHLPNKFLLQTHSFLLQTGVRHLCC